MNLKKFLNKDINYFLTQSPAENILPKSQLKKQNRKKRFISAGYRNRVDGKNSQLKFSTFKSSRFNKVKEAETQIIREFLKKVKLEPGPVLPDRVREDLGGQQARRNAIVNKTKPCPTDMHAFKEGAIRQIGLDTWGADTKSGPARQNFMSSFAWQAEHISIPTRTEDNTLYSTKHLYKAGFFFTQRSTNKRSNHFSHVTPKSQAPDIFLLGDRTSITEKNISLIFSIEQIRNLLTAKRIERQTRSELKNQLLESRKIRLLYGGLSNQQLRKIVHEGRQLPGNASDNLLILLESRLDVVLQRCGFFPSIRTARQSIVHKQIHVNFRTVTAPGYQLQPGDIFQIIQPLGKKQHKSNSLLRLNVNSAMSFSGQFKWEFSVSPSILYSLVQLESFLSATILASAVRCMNNQCAVQSKRASEFCSKMQSNNNFPQNYERQMFSIGKKNLSNQSRHRLADLKGISLFISQMIKESELHSLTRKKAPPFFDPLSKNIILGTDKKDVEKRKEGLIAPPAAKKENQIKLFPVKGKFFSSRNEKKSEKLSLHSRKTKSFSQINKDVLQSKNPVQHHYSKKGVVLSILSKLHVQKENKDINLSLLKSKTLQKKGSELSFIRQRADDRALSQTNLLSSISSLDWQVSFPWWTFKADSLESLYNTYSYWLEIKKKLTNLPQSKDEALSKDFNTFLKDQTCSQEKRIKPLHLEVSYKSCSAVFLYAPQRVYLPALIDLDLLVKAL